jgi:acetyl esterase
VGGRHTRASGLVGHPLLILERGDKVALPPALWVNGRPDPVHDYRDPESPVALNEPQRFAENYRRAGGRIELLYVDQAARMTAATYDPIAAFIHKEIALEEAAAA